jgi:hypothetical protein
MLDLPCGKEVERGARMSPVESVEGDGQRGDTFDATLSTPLKSDFPYSVLSSSILRPVILSLAR